MGTDRDALNAISNDGEARLTNQVFDTRIMGYVDDPGFPEYDVDEAKKLVSEVQGGERWEVRVRPPVDLRPDHPGPRGRDRSARLGQIGVTVNLPAPVDQAQIINLAVAGNGRFVPVAQLPRPGPRHDVRLVQRRVDRELQPRRRPGHERGARRGSLEPRSRRRARRPTRRSTSGCPRRSYNFWTWYTQWFVGARPTCRASSDPNLPDESGAPGSEEAVDILAGYHQLLGIWVDQVGSPQTQARTRGAGRDGANHCHEDGPTPGRPVDRHLLLVLHGEARRRQYRPRLEDHPVRERAAEGDAPRRPRPQRLLLRAVHPLARRLRHR